MNLKEELNQVSNKKISAAANSLAEIIKPELIKATAEGYLMYRIGLQNGSERFESYSRYAEVEKFRTELSEKLDGISVIYYQEPKYIEALGSRALVGHTPYLRFSWHQGEEDEE